MPVQTTLLAFVPSLLIAAGVLAALWRPWIKGNAPRPAWAGAVAIACAYIASDCFVWRSFPGLWSNEEQRRLPLVAVLALVVAVTDSALKNRLSRTWLAWIVGAVLMTPILYADISRPRAYPGPLLFWFLYSGVFVMIWTENAAAARRIGGARVPLVLCLAAAGTCVVLMQHQTASIALTAAGLSAAMGAFVIVGWWRPDLRPVAGATPVFAALLPGLLAAASFGVPLSLFSAALVLLSAGTVGLGDRGPFRALKPWAATLACALLTVVLAAAAVWLSPGGFDFKPE